MAPKLFVTHYRRFYSEGRYRFPSARTGGEVKNVSNSSSEPASLVVYDTDSVSDQDLTFLKDVREGRYEHIRCGIPFIFMYRTMNASLLRETHRLDAITVEKPSQTETPSLYKRPSPASGWQTMQSVPTIH